MLWSSSFERDLEREPTPGLGLGPLFLYREPSDAGAWFSSPEPSKGADSGAPSSSAVPPQGADSGPRSSSAVPLKEAVDALVKLKQSSLIPFTPMAPLILPAPAITVRSKRQPPPVSARGKRISRAEHILFVARASLKNAISSAQSEI